nr:multiprotein-bridging factor 1c [Tanacetum cinerariifolium]
MRKLDEAEEPAAIERVGAEVRKMIQKARIEKKMSQAELAKRINERPQVVQEYENGKAVPNQGVLAKMERVLGVKLRGKIHKVSTCAPARKAWFMDFVSRRVCESFGFDLWSTTGSQSCDIALIGVKGLEGSFSGNNLWIKKLGLE